MIIQPAHFPKDTALVQQLFDEYERYLDIDLAFQNFSQEKEVLPGKYAEPKGGIALAKIGDEAAGCVCWYPLKDDICEIKRLFIRPAFRGKGAGRALLSHAVEAAKSAGYRKVCLDSLERLPEAKKLYESFGFTPIAPYNFNPYPDVYYMALDLCAATPTKTPTLA